MFCTCPVRSSSPPLEENTKEQNGSRENNLTLFIQTFFYSNKDYNLQCFKRYRIFGYLFSSCQTCFKQSIQPLVELIITITYHLMISMSDFDLINESTYQRLFSRYLAKMANWPIVPINLKSKKYGIMSLSSQLKTTIYVTSKCSLSADVDFNVKSIST